MFHQVFICNTEHEEEVITEPPFVKQDVIISGPEVKDESNEMILKTDDLNFEAKPCVKTELIQNMKLDLEPEPQLEEPSEILPDIRPMEDKEASRKASSDKGNTGNISSKTVSLEKKLNITKVIKNMKRKYVLHVGKSDKQKRLQIKIQRGPNPNVRSTQDTTKCHMQSESGIEQYISSIDSKSGDSGKRVRKSEALHGAASSSKIKKISSLDDEIVVPPNMEADSASDWEEELTRATEGLASSQTSKNYEQTSSESQLNDEENTDFHSIDSDHEESVKEPIINDDTEEKKFDNFKFSKLFFSNVDGSIAEFKLINSNPDITVISNSTYLCNICDKVLENKRKLKYHVTQSYCSRKKNKPKVPVQDNLLNKRSKFSFCTVCGKEFKTRHQLHYHTKFSLCNGYRRTVKLCHICGKVFSAATFEDHQNIHINVKPYKCTECDQCFYSNKTRSKHIKKEHRTPKLFFLCSFCGVTSESISHMLAHEETHRLHKPDPMSERHKCNHCEKRFVTRSKLAEHLRDHRKIKCSKCGVESNTITSYQKHMVEVHGIVKTFNCQMCDKTFKSHSHLKLHVSTHSTVPTIFCEICDRGFKHKRRLQVHMVCHSNERPISCPECGKNFKRNNHLRRHLKSTHGEGRKPRKCTRRTQL